MMLRQTVVLDRFHPALRKRIQIWTACRERQSSNITGFDDFPKYITVLGVTFVDEISTIIENPPFLPDDIPSHLLHPGFIGMWVDLHDVNATALSR